ncbi:EthD family reductase [Nonomuraea ferruginea]
MAYQLLALYHHPESTAAFDKHYDEVHAPLAARLPGLRSYTATRPGGAELAYYLVAVLTFGDEAAFNTAMGSDVGQQAVTDLANFAGAGVTMLTGPADTVV